MGGGVILRVGTAVRRRIKSSEWSPRRNRSTRIMYIWGIGRREACGKGVNVWVAECIS